MHEYGTTQEKWAEVAVSTRRWAQLNPRAMHRDPLTVAQVLESRMVAWPLRRLNICLVTDAGGAAGLLGMAAWLGVQGEKEDSNRRESTRREGTRMVHEEVDKRGKRSEYTVVLGNRFVVSAQGNADIAELKSAVNGLDLAKLEALK